jgi:hypothetical protein
MNLNNVVEVQQITTFKDDSSLVSYSKPDIEEPSSWTSMAHEDASHSVISILQRPVRIYNVAMDATTVFPSWKFPDILLQSNTNIVDKLNYFTYFRANVKVRIVFNSTPFISGRYWAYFSPYPTESNRNFSSIQNATGYPGVEIDLASNSPVEIKIPYCAPLSHYNLITTFSTMGTLNLRALNTIAAGTTPPPSIFLSIFAWFEDVELSLPTSLPVRVPVLLAQVGNEMPGTLGGNISNTLSNLSVASSMLSKDANLGAVAKQVSWATRLAAGVASSFGFSKPTNLESNRAVMSLPAKGFTNSNNIDYSQKLSMLPDNEIRETPGIFSSSVDEMSIPYVCSKSCVLLTNEAWTAAAAADTVLFEFPVTPGASVGVGTIVRPSTLGFVASMFQYWRGGIVYRMTAAKTAFHSGRLRVTFHPGVYSSTDPLVYENAYNWIFDLSTSSEITFTIPYVSNAPYREVLIDDVDSPALLAERYSLGIITITVLNELRVANSSASSTVLLNLWIAGDQDISFSVPHLRHVPTSDDALVAQIFNETPSDIAHNEQVSSISDTMFPKRKMQISEAEQLVIGEKVMSLRSLIKRFSLINYGHNDPYTDLTRTIFSCPGPYNAPISTADIINGVVIDPAYMGEIMTGTQFNHGFNFPTDSTNFLPTVPKPLITDTTPSISCFMYYISYLYRFRRGSIRYKMFVGNSNKYQVVASDSLTTQTFKVVNNKTSVVPYRVFTAAQNVYNGTISRPAASREGTENNFGTAEHIVFPDENGCIEFEVPYYTDLPIQLNCEGAVLNDEGPLTTRSRVVVSKGFSIEDSITMALGVSISSVPSVTFTTGFGMISHIGAYRLYSAAGDDFSFGYQIGAPSIILK